MSIDADQPMHMTMLPMSGRPNVVRLSAFVCVRNEETKLANCLSHLRFADEIVVLVDRSDDTSSLIAHSLADLVIEGVYPFEGLRRATAEAACTGDWVLEVDADEIIPEDLALEIRNAMAGPMNADWFLLSLDNYVGSKLIRHGWGGSFGTSAVARFYRRGCKTWGMQQVHPTVCINGKCGGKLKHPIQHKVDKDVSDMLRRLDRYTQLNAYDLQGRSRRYGLISHLFRGFRRFWKCYFTRRGYREGEWGVLIALMAAIYPILSELRARIEPHQLPHHGQPTTCPSLKEDETVA